MSKEKQEKNSGNEKLHQIIITHMCLTLIQIEEENPMFFRDYWEN